MKKITSRTYFITAEGMRVSITFSEIDSKGNIVKENQRINRVVVDQDYINLLNEIQSFEQKIVEEEG